MLLHFLFCTVFLIFYHYKFSTIVAADTAGSAKYLSENKSSSEAAIASSLAAKIYLNKKNLFIGKNGNIIEFHSDKEKYKLPEFFGNYNKKEFLTLISIIDEINFGYQNINSFYFFLNERWDIKTKDGVLIKLPKKNLKNSLIKAKIILNDEKIKKIKIIDLRISNNLIITHV